MLDLGNIFEGVDKNELIQSIINPLGQLNLSDSEKKLLFFRHVGAEYAMSARKNRVPYAQNIAKAATSFSGLGGGSDPMMMLMMMSMGDKKETTPSTPVESQLEKVLTHLVVQIDKIADKVMAAP
jgi:hypothetical protein